MKVQLRFRTLLALAAGYVFAVAPMTRAVDVAPAYNSNYTITSLGQVPGMPNGVSDYLGGLTLKAGDPNTLLIAGQANIAAGAIYQIGLTRDANMNITGLSGTATKYADAPYIDGGLTYGPVGVLFYTTNRGTLPGTNSIGQFKPGSTTLNKLIDLSTLGIGGTTGSIAFAPDGSLKILQYYDTGSTPGKIYSASVTADGNGTYNITNVSLVGTYGKGLEGLVYVPTGSALFPQSSVLLTDYWNSKISAYDIDSNYNPILATKRDFVTGLTGAEGAFLDPYSNNFLFAQLGVSKDVMVVKGFAAVPEPSTWALGVIATGTLAYLARRRKA